MSSPFARLAFQFIFITGLYNVNGQVIPASFAHIDNSWQILFPELTAKGIYFLEVADENHRETFRIVNLGDE